MGVQATYGKVPLKGVFIVQVHDDVALMSGFQAPANKIEQTAPVMQRILSSLRFIERIPLQRYVESNEGAFSGYVPQGWHVRAMIRRTSDSASAPLTDFRTMDQTGTISMEVPPHYDLQIDHVRAVGTWTARITGKMRAPADQFAEQEPIFMGIVEAVQPNPQWQQRERARSDRLFLQAGRRMVRVQQEYATALQNLHHVQLEIAQDMREGVNRRIDAFNELRHDRDNILQGRQDMIDSIDGKQYNVEPGPGSYWVGDGYVHRGNYGDRPPKPGLHRLEPL